MDPDGCGTPQPSIHSGNGGMVSSNSPFMSWIYYEIRAMDGESGLGRSQEEIGFVPIEGSREHAIEHRDECSLG
jgi:hypothetical protein